MSTEEPETPEVPAEPDPNEPEVDEESFGDSEPDDVGEE